MKLRSREVNVFGLALMDVLSCALGAFLFLSLTLMDTLQRVISGLDNETQRQTSGSADDLRDEVERLRREKQALEDELDQEEARSNRLEQQRDQERELRLDTYQIAAAMDFDFTGADPDLWMKLPSGRWAGPKFEYRAGVQRVFATSDARKPDDFEVVQYKRPDEGRYIICYRIQSRATNAATLTIRGFMSVNLPSYRQYWRLGTQNVIDTGRTHVWMVFDVKDGNFEHVLLDATEKEKLEDELNSEGNGPPVILEDPNAKEPEPSPTPTPSPSPSPSPSPRMSPEVSPAEKSSPEKDVTKRGFWGGLFD
ncbi:MAG: hypothetical protein KDD69_17010 [Bdellovibrionales bacterium]|nr:hypothetical protein [Bdellovibrionales bacterium]